jgi:hypothetical protein
MDDAWAGGRKELKGTGVGMGVISRGWVDARSLETTPVPFNSLRQMPFLVVAWRDDLGLFAADHPARTDRWGSGVRRLRLGRRPFPRRRCCS